ncbi:hypothetical protein RchiOBHm_Chr6g0297041 [Rosa chinensis]|uniref:Uncharacterized protein n=1 Tax=Rosa chinensis TaxID=74649 RepID=A0A2P6PXK1_ROSCH|nr:hypothetical protein RchiOBHm_Chr6g0297041 [Rosa chinensis]
MEMVSKKLEDPAGAAILWSLTDPKPVGKLEATKANWCKPKKGTVFPVKRRLVKTMMFDSIVKFVASVFSSSKVPNPMISLSAPKIPKAKICNHTRTYPHPSPDHVGKLAHNESSVTSL